MKGNIYRFDWAIKNQASPEWALTSDSDARQLVILANQLGLNCITIRKWNVEEKSFKLIPFFFSHQPTV